MTLHKSTIMDGRHRTHAWADPDVPFYAECRKGDKAWVAEVGASVRIDTTYQGAVDWVMDKYRLALAGLTSWDKPAAILAGVDGLDYDLLPAEDKNRYVEAAQENARNGVLR